MVLNQSTYIFQSRRDMIRVKFIILMLFKKDWKIAFIIIKNFRKL